MNINKIELALSEKSADSPTDYELLVYAKSIQLLKNGAVFTAKNYADLPSASLNEGKIYFLESIETLVWSNGTDWLNFEDKKSSNASLWSVGNNSSGLLAVGNTTNRCFYTREVCNGTNWCQVSTGGPLYAGSAAIKTDGSLWVWGCGSYGVNGNGTTTIVSCSPVREICSATDWFVTSRGSGITFAIKNDGSLWGWGRGSCGALGDGTTVDKCSPVREICSATDWCFVSAPTGSSTSNFSVAAIKEDGSLWAWGKGSGGYLGTGTTSPTCSPVREICSATNWCQVQKGMIHTSAVKTDGTLWSWGNNFFFTFGNGINVSSCSPVREFCLATNWCQVTTQCTSGAAIKTDGSLWSWGCNFCGNLGTGTTTNSCSPVREFFSATNWCLVSKSQNIDGATTALKTDGSLWAWGGFNQFGEYGDGTTVSKCSPIREAFNCTCWCMVSSNSTRVHALVNL